MESIREDLYELEDKKFNLEVSIDELEKELGNDIIDIILKVFIVCIFMYMSLIKIKKTFTNGKGNQPGASSSSNPNLLSSRNKTSSSSKLTTPQANQNRTSKNQPGASSIRNQTPLLSGNQDSSSTPLLSGNQDSSSTPLLSGIQDSSSIRNQTPLLGGNQDSSSVRNQTPLLSGIQDSSSSRNQSYSSENQTEPPNDNQTPLNQNKTKPPSDNQTFLIDNQSSSSDNQTFFNYFFSGDNPFLSYSYRKNNNTNMFSIAVNSFVKSFFITLLYLILQHVLIYKLVGRFSPSNTVQNINQSLMVATVPNSDIGFLYPDLQDNQGAFFYDKEGVKTYYDIFEGSGTPQNQTVTIEVVPEETYEYQIPDDAVTPTQTFRIMSEKNQTEFDMIGNATLYSTIASNIAGNSSLLTYSIIENIEAKKDSIQSSYDLFQLQVETLLISVQTYINTIENVDSKKSALSNRLLKMFEINEYLENPSLINNLSYNELARVRINVLSFLRDNNVKFEFKDLPEVLSEEKLNIKQEQTDNYFNNPNIDENELKSYVEMLENIEKGKDLYSRENVQQIKELIDVLYPLEEEQPEQPLHMKLNTIGKVIKYNINNRIFSEYLPITTGYLGFGTLDSKAKIYKENFFKLLRLLKDTKNNLQKGRKQSTKVAGKLNTKVDNILIKKMKDAGLKIQDANLLTPG